MQPYTYLIRCIPENKVYYGVRYSKNSNPKELGITYFSSTSIGFKWWNNGIINTRSKESPGNSFILGKLKVIKIHE